MHISRSFLLALLILMSVPTVSYAQYGKGVDIAKGEIMARKFCAECHNIQKEGPSPLTIAPPFRGFSAKWPLSLLEEALAEGIVTGHSDMPEFELLPVEIINLLSFIDSISPK